MEEDVEGLHPFVFVEVSSAVLGYQQALAADRVDCTNRGNGCEVIANRLATTLTHR